jgi:hypothetical protein
MMAVAMWLSARKLRSSFSYRTSSRNDRERRNALISRDVRIVLCRLLTIAGIIAIAVLSLGAAGLLARLTTLLYECGRAVE